MWRLFSVYEEKRRASDVDMEEEEEDMTWMHGSLVFYVLER